MSLHTPGSPGPKQNQLLAALSPTDFNHLLPDLKLVTMPLGKVIYESGVLLNHLYPRGLYYFVAVCHAKRRRGGNCRDGQ